MAATFKITDGASDEVNLLDTSNFEVRDLPMGVVRGLTQNQVATEIVVKLNPQSTQDAAASDFVTFNRLLKRAVDFHKTDREYAPIYFQQKADSETNSRFALIMDVLEMPDPSTLDYLFKSNKAFLGLTYVIVREYPWRSIAPGTLGSAISLTASDGPSSPTRVHIANFRDDVAVTHIFRYDSSGTSFSANLIAATEFNIFPGGTGVGDGLYIGSTDNAFKHVIIPIGTAGDYTAIIRLRYYDSGTGWTTATLGTDYTILNGEAASLTTGLKLVGDLAINFFPPSTWTNTTINSVDAYWLFVEVQSSTSWSTIPATSTDAVYTQRSNYVEIPAASIKGDAPPLSCIRLYSPSGGGTTVGPANLSLILVYAKSAHSGIDLSNFEPWINPGGNDNPAAWSVAYGTDTSSENSVTSPGGARATCDFSTTSSMTARVTITGDNLLEDYRGTYRLLVGVQQTGGSAGDCSLQGKIYVGGNTTTDPSAPTRTRKTRGADNGIEVIDLGLFSLPRTRAYKGDTLTNTDIAISVLAERTTGASNLDFEFIFLAPVTDGSVGVEDALMDTTNGSSALRGGNAIDLDSGMIAYRAQKHITVGGNLIPADNEWGIEGGMIQFEQLATQTRLYFLMLHYATGNDWNTEPYVMTLGNHLAGEIYMAYSYRNLRGSD